MPGLTPVSEGTETLTPLSEVVYADNSYALYPSSTSYPRSTTYPGSFFSVVGETLTPFSEGTETLQPLLEV